ncbi:hypothetical protein [Thalassolituus marinus]|uniref:Uncharacterized protein n=1 Tax=Thalassolituus marinus TaxID=671053 RepID=A0ABS7ZXV9_9GAMM|nr:hypothetical protein [Thalassolituus marinus]MCA6065445.1 hypothetical protein [Thalassolituus marinus]
MFIPMPDTNKASSKAPISIGKEKQLKLGHAVEVTFKTLDNIPDADRFGGCIDVVAIRYDIRPVLIMAQNRKHTGPELNLAIDYYAPAAIARMGMPIKQTRIIVHTPGTPEDGYVEAFLPGIIKDPWGTDHAGNGHIEWKELAHEQFERIMRSIDKPVSAYLGKTGVFMTGDGILIHRKIDSYTGLHYVSAGEKIDGKLLRIQKE